jgi:DNA-binding NarL/FixJ family response regulator
MVTVLHEGPPAITDRQLQVIELIAAEYSNDEVARRLGISPRTARGHSDMRPAEANEGPRFETR